MCVVQVLSQPVMTATEASRQLRMPARTLVNWLEGHTVGNRFHEPVLRPEPLGHNDMTWGEVVEATFLRAYRVERGVSMQTLRPLIALLREEFKVPYPLAHVEPFVDGKRGMMLELQDEAGLANDLWLVTKGPHGQFVLNPLVEREYLDKVDFAEGGRREGAAAASAGQDLARRDRPPAVVRCCLDPRCALRGPGRPRRRR